MKDYPRIIPFWLWGAIIATLVVFFVTGCCCPACEPTIHYSPSGKPFPANWSEPPEIQTKDYRQLPYGYGHGSSTLHNWIIKNRESDFQSRWNNLPSSGTF